MRLDEITISKAIASSFLEKFQSGLEADVVIVGGGPTGLVASYYMAKKKVKVVLFERKLSVGGGMWGGGMMFNQIVVQEESKRILDQFGIRYERYEKGYYLADSIEATSTLCSQATKAGARIFNLMSAEDVMIRDERVTGVVINWSAVGLAKLHVDPMTARCKFLVDATGHESEVARIIEGKGGHRLNTETGRIMGEKSMWAEVGEKAILDNTKEIFPGVYVAGMAANAVFGGPRMGPIFGGMLLSGEKVARLLIGRLHKAR